MLPKILLLLGLLLLLVIISAVVIGYFISAPRYAGPVSDHFDGTGFFTPDAPSPKGFREVIGWQLNRERTQPWGAFHGDQPGPARSGVIARRTGNVRESLDGAAPVRWAKRTDGPHLRAAG